MGAICRVLVDHPVAGRRHTRQLCHGIEGKGGRQPPLKHTMTKEGPSRIPLSNFQAGHGYRDHH